MLKFPWADMKIKTKNAKNGFTSTVNLAGLLLTEGSVTTGNAESKFFWYTGTSRNYGMIYKFPVITGTANFMETYLKLCKLSIFDVKLKLTFFIFLDL